MILPQLAESSLHPRAFYGKASLQPYAACRSWNACNRLSHQQDVWATIPSERAVRSKRRSPARRNLPVHQRQRDGPYRIRATRVDHQRLILSVPVTSLIRLSGFRKKEQRSPFRRSPVRRRVHSIETFNVLSRGRVTSSCRAWRR